MMITVATRSGLDVPKWILSHLSILSAALLQSGEPAAALQGDGPVAANDPDYFFLDMRALEELVMLEISEQVQAASHQKQVSAQARDLANYFSSRAAVAASLGHSFSLPAGLAVGESGVSAFVADMLFQQIVDIVQLRVSSVRSNGEVRTGAQQHQYVLDTAASVTMRLAKDPALLARLRRRGVGIRDLDAA